MLTIRWSRNTVYNVLTALLIVTIWAFNETKTITYPVKIAYILFLGYYSIKKRRTSDSYQIWCIVMCVISGLAMLIAPSISASLYTFINLLQVFLIGFVTFGYVDDEKKVSFVLQALVLGGIVLAVRLIIVTPANVWLSWQRLGDAIGSNSNDVGNKTAFSAIIALSMAKSSQRKKRIIYLIAFGILLVIVLFSGSRKALIAVVIGAILLYTIGLQRKRRLVVSALVIGAILFFGYRLMMSNGVLYATIGRRIETMIDVFFHGGSEAHSIDLREKYLLAAWGLIKQHPLFGIGLGAFSYISGYGVYSHCDYTEVACSFGLIGFIIYYLPLSSQTLKYVLLRKKSDLDYGFLIIQIVLFITYITMVMYTSAYTQFIIAVLIVHYRINEKKRTDVVSIPDHAY